MRVDQVIETQLLHQLKHIGDILLVHPGKSLVQGDDKGRLRTRLLVAGIGCGKKRYIHGHCFFTAAEDIESMVRQLSFLLIAAAIMESEGKPAAVVQDLLDQLVEGFAKTSFLHGLPGLLDLGFEMTDNLFKICFLQDARIPAQQLNQLPGIQLILAPGGARTPAQGEGKSTGGLALGHESIDLFNPLLRPADPTPDHPPHVVGDDLFVKFPIFFT